MVTTHKKNNSKGYKSISVFEDEIQNIIGLAKNQTGLIRSIKEYLTTTNFFTYFSIDKAHETFVKFLLMMDSPPFPYADKLPYSAKKVINAIPGLKRVSIGDPWDFIAQLYEPLSTELIRETIVEHNSANLDPDFGWQKEKHKVALNKLIDILDSDPNMKRLIGNTIFGIKRSVIPELIINKKIALSNLKLMVNFKEDIKTNTDLIFLKLNKEFPRPDIYNIVLDCFNGNKSELKRKRAYEKAKSKDMARKEH